MFHLAFEERRAADVSPSTLRNAVLADIEADDPTRMAYVDVRLAELDISDVVLDGSHVGAVRLYRVTVDGTLDLSGAELGHPLVVEDCRIGHLNVTGASFEKDLEVDGSVLGDATGSATCFRARRAVFEQSCRFQDVRFEGSVEFAGCRVDGWLDVDGVTVGGRAHFPNVSVGTAQVVSTTFEDDVEFIGSTAEQATFDRPRVTADGPLDLSETAFGSLRVLPGTDLECLLDDATVEAGRLCQPESGVGLYDLTDATVGDVDIECRPDTFDRYRFYRTTFDGFAFASYRELLRANRWCLHEYARESGTPETTDGLERTYLRARQGASEAGDNETASMFFVRELRYRRQRYGAHARDPTYSSAHRFEAALGWVTNAFLDFVSGYGERPQRTVVLSLAVIVGGALAYPATAGLDTGGRVVRYATHGLPAVVDGLYFSVVTFATLGLGDVHPVGSVGRLLAASEGLAGAFLTALFVFSLGRRVTR